MNYIITIASLLLFDGSFQTLPAVQSERLEGVVVSYDADMSLRTSQADFIVKLNTSDGKKYIRLRYSPHGFGFDQSLDVRGKVDTFEKIRISPAQWYPFGAPPAKPKQLVPKVMFSVGSVVWIFQAHSPRNPEERVACYRQIKRYLPGKDGLPVEVERFAYVPGPESEIIPKPESLSCLILEDWTLKE
jgi:hypothetical protein